MEINSDMVTLAREFRGMTQTELAKGASISQAKIAKLEGGINTDVPEQLAIKLSAALNFPMSFFSQKDDVLGFGSSAYYYRKKAKITAGERKYIHSKINLLRINLKKLLSSVDVQGKRALPKLDIEEFDGNASDIARAVRASWNLPDGPIKNLTRVVESAGIIVIPVDFKSDHMDGTSLMLGDMPPLIFLNANQPGDRWRFTLAHELAHLVMHEVSRETMEDEADQFASEFLMPEYEIAPHFQRLSKVRLSDVYNLKSYWRCSAASIIKTAGNLGFINQNQSRYLWSSLSKGGRKHEANPIDLEEVSTYTKLLEYHKDTLDFNQEELSELFNFHPQDLHELYVSLFPRVRQKPELRLIVQHSSSAL